MATIDLRGSNGTLRLSRNGGNATIRSFLVLGPKGDPGTNGTNGANGRDGTNGRDGAPGAQGLPGVNAVANDTATATQITTAGTATQAALTAHYQGIEQQFAPLSLLPTAQPCVVTVTNDVSTTTVPTTVRAPAPNFLCSYAPNDLTRMTYYGSAPTVDTGASFPDNKSASFDHVRPPSVGHDLNAFMAESLHRGRYCEFWLKQFSGGLYWIWVDGKPLTMLPQTLGGTAGSTGSVLLDFGVTGGYRRIELRGVGVRYYGMNVDTDSRCVATNRVGPRLAVVCDSGGGGAGGVSALTTFVHLMGPHLGIRDVWNLSVGGSGYLNGGAGNTARDRLQRLIDSAPDVVFVMMGHNDTSYTQTAIRDEVVAYLSAMRTALPNAQIIVASPWHENSDPTGYAALTSTIFAAAAPYANKLLDVNTYSPFTAENIPLYILAVDHVHPSQDGHFYWAWWLALRLRPLLLAPRTQVIAPPALTTGVPFSDNFNRADSATTMGSYWTPLAGRVWGISGNKAYLVSGGTQNFVVHDAETPDVQMTVTVGGSSAGGQGFCFRMQDNANGYIAVFNSAGHMKLTKQVGGGYTDIGDYTGNAVPGDVLQLICKGSAITLKKNGTTVLSITDTTYLTPSSHGFYASAVQSAAVQAWDDFSMVSAP